MKRLALVVIALAVIASQGAFAQDAARLLKAAINTEMVDGDPKAAIEQYKKVVASGNRALAAQALLRMAGCYQKLGDAEAQKILAQIVHDYTDQTEVVAEAKRRMGGKAPVPMRRLLWTVPQGAEVGQVSPDGKSIAYSNRADGNIYLHNFEAGQDRAITGPSSTVTASGASGEGRAAGGYSFSKDGNHLAYSWRVSVSTTEVRVVDIGRSGAQPPRVVMRRDQPGWIHTRDWSADGQWLLVDWFGEKGVELAVVSAQDGAIQLRTQVSQIEPLEAIFSPDGKYVAFSPMQDGAAGRWNIVAIEVSTGREIDVVQAPGSHEVKAWTRDGAIVFASDRGGVSSLWSIRMLDGVPGAARPLGIDGEFRWSLGLSMPGALFYREMPREFDDIVTFRLNLATGDVLSGPMNAAGLAGSNRWPAWSPDGTRLAYLSYRPGGEQVIVVQSMDKGDVQQLRPDLKSVDTCGWTADGAALLCRGERLSSSQGMYRVDVRTGATSLVLRTQGYVRRWSEDGRKVYIDGLDRSADGNMMVIEHDVSTGTQREIFRGVPGGETRLALSADGRTIFHRSPVSYAGPHDLIARDVATGNETTLVSKQIIGGLSLSPDGRLIVSSAYPGFTAPRLLLVRTDGTGFQDFGSDVRFLEWSPDSRSFIAGKLAGVAGPRPTLWWIPVDGRPARQLNLGDVSIDLRRFGPGTVLPGRKEIAIGAQSLALNVHDAVGGPDQIWVLENLLSGAGGRGAGGR